MPQNALVVAITVGVVACPLQASGQLLPTATLTASPASVPYGQSSTLTWSSANATACNGIGKGFSPSVLSGSRAVSPDGATTYSVACNGARGSASQAVTVAVTATPSLTVGETVAAVGTLRIRPTPTLDISAIGSEASGNEGVVIGGPVSNSSTWWRVAFIDNLTGWVFQDGLAPASPNAPTLWFRANPWFIAPGPSSTLSWSSTNATSCSGANFSPSGLSGSLAVSPVANITYRITCTGSAGSTTRSAMVTVNPAPNFSWKQSLPVTFNDSAIVPFGGTETRALVFMDGSLYAGIGDWKDPEFENPQTPGAQVLRLDSPTSSWVEDRDFNQPLPGQTTKKNYLEVSALGTARFDRDYASNPITPVDVLMAGFVSMGNGLTIFEKTVKTGSVGAQGTWTKVSLVEPPHANGQVRSFASYTDSVIHQEMAFAGSDPYGIFSGAFNSTRNGIQWGATAEAGTASLTDKGQRVMSFAACGGKLYASIYDAIAVRTDGANPSWQVFYRYSGPPLNSKSSGFRGLTCVPNLHGSGSMLIAALEGDSPDIYEFPLDGSHPSIELRTANFVSTKLGTRVGYGIAAYNNMIVYPKSGSKSCPDLLIGLSIITPDYGNDYEAFYPNPTFLIRHCNGFYGFRTIDPSITPAPSPIATRALAVSEFSGDPAGTIYAGGFDAHGRPAHNTDWIYRGIPMSPSGRAAAATR